MARPIELLQFVNFDFRVERDERGYYSINWREYQEHLKEGTDKDMPAVPERPLLGRSADEKPIHVSVAKYLQSHRNDALFNTLLKHQEYLRRVLEQVSRGEELQEPTLLNIFEHAPRMYNAVVREADKFKEALVAEDYFDIPYWDFQSIYFRGDLSKVRRCFQCGQFFFDTSDDQKVHFCSEDCQAKGVRVVEPFPEKAKAEKKEQLERVARGEAELRPTDTGGEKGE